ncbi:NUDIX domain-containing protein [Nocardia sp. NPDC004068]|uniref:NUDIX domain-containing protein n=1 Tax=Nocardia sp. NPDC004068 TaxID=3364303 RepID=UPI0036CDAA4E
MVHSSLLGQLTADATRDKIQHLAVGAVIQFNGKVLLLQQPSDDFMGGFRDLPRGTVEPHEGIDQALIRAVKMETGLDVTRIVHYLGDFDYESGSGEKIRQFNFTVDVASPEPIVLHEHDAYTWTALVEEPPVTDAVRRILAHYQERVSGR